MKTSAIEIDALLQKEDIEGLIEAGAPSDEYFSEAEFIASALNDIPKQDFTAENIVATIASIWAKNFNLGQDETALRIPAIQKISAAIAAIVNQ